MSGGVATRHTDKGNDERRNGIAMIWFPAEECGRSPLRCGWIPNTDGRRARLNGYERLLQEATRREETGGSKKLYKKSCSVWAISHAERHGGLAARYVGLAETRF